MIGIVVVAHFGLGEKFVEAATAIVGKTPKNIIAVGIDDNEEVLSINEDIMNAIKQVSSPDGVLILTDMFGGTPCNMSMPFLNEGHLEVLTGLNLPMLIEALDGRSEGKTIAEFAQHLQSIGQKNICLASDILSKKPSDG